MGAAAVVTGFLGAYTTFSTFSLDTYRLLEDGHTGQAGFNAFGTLAAGLVAVWLGLTARSRGVGRRVCRPGETRLAPTPHPRPARRRAPALAR